MMRKVRWPPESACSGLPIALVCEGSHVVYGEVALYSCANSTLRPSMNRPRALSSMGSVASYRYTECSQRIVKACHCFVD